MEIAGFRSKYSDEQIEALLDAAANGGGDAPSGGGPSYEYFVYPENEYSDKDLFAQKLNMYACQIKFNTDAFDGTPRDFIMSSLMVAGMMMQMSGKMIAYSIDMNMVVTVTTQLEVVEPMTVRDVLRNYIDNHYPGETTIEEIDAIIASLPRLTEEEFYNLNA